MFGQKLLLLFLFGALATKLEFQRFGFPLTIAPGEIFGCCFSLSSSQALCSVLRAVLSWHPQQSRQGSCWLSACSATPQSWWTMTTWVMAWCSKNNLGLFSFKELHFVTWNAALAAAKVELCAWAAPHVCQAAAARGSAVTASASSPGAHHSVHSPGVWLCWAVRGSSCATSRIRQYWGMRTFLIF